MRVERHAPRTVRRHHPPQRGARPSRANLRIGVQLHRNDRPSIERHHRHPRVDARFGVVEKRRLQLRRFGRGPMARLRPGHPPVVLDPDQQRAPFAVGEADHLLVNRPVVHRRVLLALELIQQGLALANQALG